MLSDVVSCFKSEANQAHLHLAMCWQAQAFFEVPGELHVVSHKDTVLACVVCASFA